MSTNVTSTDYLNGELRVDASVWEEWLADNSTLAEGNFLDRRAHVVNPDTGEVTIKYPWWYGECSGISFDRFEKMLEQTKGKADILVCWEGGDEYEGYRVTDGKVEKKKVKMVLE